MPVPERISDYLREFASELGDRILESFPPLHGVNDPPSPMIHKLLRKPYSAQTQAIMGLVLLWERARAGAVIAECGTSLQSGHTCSLLKGIVLHYLCRCQ